MSRRRTTSKETETMNEETETPKPADVAGRIDGLVMQDGYLILEVQGAGNLILGLGSVWKCGTASGVYVGCTWGKHGEAGGTMDVSEVRKMHAALDEWLANFNPAT